MAYYNNTSSLHKLCLNEITKNLLRHKANLKFIPPHIKSELVKIACCREYLLEDIVLLTNLLHNHLEDLNFSNFCVKDEMLEATSVCLRLKTFIVGDNNKDVTHKGLAGILTILTKLETFIIRNCDVFDDKLVDILVSTCPHLTTLDIANCCSLTDEAMRQIGKLQLNALNISGTNITDAGVLHFFQGECANVIKEFIVCRCPITCISLNKIFSRCPMLSIFTFEGCNFTGEYHIPLRGVKHLSWNILP